MKTLLDKSASHKQAGFSLMEIVVTLGVSAIMVTMLASTIADQQYSMVYARQKIEAAGLESNLAKIFSDEKTCSCIFNPSNNTMVKSGGVVKVNGLGSAGSAGASNQKISLAKIPFIPLQPDGTCNYGVTRSLIQEGEYYGDPMGRLKVKEIYIDNLRKVGEDSLNQVKGTVNIQFEHKENGKILTKHPLLPAQADMVFFVDGGGVARTCDPREKIDDFFNDKLLTFQTEQDQKFNDLNSEFETTQTKVIDGAVVTVTNKVKTTVTKMSGALTQTNTKAEDDAARSLASELEDAKKKLNSLQF